MAVSSRLFRTSSLVVKSEQKPPLLLVWLVSGVEEARGVDVGSVCSRVGLLFSAWAGAGIIIELAKIIAKIRIRIKRGKEKLEVIARDISCCIDGGKLGS